MACPLTPKGVASGPRKAYSMPMDRMNLETDATLSPETEAEQRARVTWEATGIAKARSQLGAGLYVDATEIAAWIDIIGTDHELPPPPTRRR